MELGGNSQLALTQEQRPQEDDLLLRSPRHAGIQVRGAEVWTVEVRQL